MERGLFCGRLCVGGCLVDKLLRQGFNDSLVRQTILIGGMVMGLGLLGTIFTKTPGIAVLWISTSIGGLAASAPIAWSAPSLLAPHDSVARVGGIMNFANQLAAIAAPIVTGYLIACLHCGGVRYSCRDCRICIPARQNRTNSGSGKAWRRPVLSHGIISGTVGAVPRRQCHRGAFRIHPGAP